MPKQRGKLTDKQQPKPNGNNKNKRGRFVKGNKAAVGRAEKPADQKAHQLKQALINAISVSDIKVIARRLILKAKKGDVIAAREIFDRLWGRAKQEVDIGENMIKSLVDIAARMGCNGSSE